MLHATPPSVPMPHDCPLSPPLQPLTNPVREDSSMEPPALRPTGWPSSRDHHRTPSPTLPFPRSLTAPINSLSTLAFSFDSDFPPFPDQKPVQLSPRLTPSMRDALPHPKPVRPQPLTNQSDLSAASTRAENEPLALRDLRRVTAPPSLMDPWVYDRARLRERNLQKHTNRMFAKSLSTTSIITETAVDPIQQHHFSAVPEQTRWRMPNRPFPERKFVRRKWFQRTELYPNRIPDRFQAAPSEHNPDTASPKAESVVSAVTADSDAPEEPVGHRWRSISEAGLNRRPSFVAGKKKVLSLWEKLRRRSRNSSDTNPRRSPHRSDAHQPNEKRHTKKRSERRMRKLLPPLFRPLEYSASRSSGR